MTDQGFSYPKRVKTYELILLLLKGLSAIRNIFKSLRNKEKYLLITACITVSLKNHIILTKNDFYRISFRFSIITFTGHCFSPYENFPKFWDNISCLSSNKSYLNTQNYLNTIIIILKLSITMPHGKKKH